MPKRIPVCRPYPETPRDKDRKPIGRIHGTARWQRVRARHLATHPLCVMCEAEGLINEASIVHHVIDVADRPDLAFNESNHQSLCKRHHDSETARRRNQARLTMPGKGGVAR